MKHEDYEQVIRPKVQDTWNIHNVLVNNRVKLDNFIVLFCYRHPRDITSYGLDSLMAIELRNWIAKELRANLKILECCRVVR